MNDRLAFRALVSVAGFMMFCLTCLLTLPLRVGWVISSVWVVCCSMLIAHPSMPQPIPTWLAWLATLLAGPIGMGAMMWWMHRGMSHPPAVESPPIPQLEDDMAVRNQALEARLAELEQRLTARLQIDQ